MNLAPASEPGTGLSVCPHLMRRWHKGTRYYEARVCLDLFGSICLRLTFGSRSTRYARDLTRVYPDHQDAERAFHKVAAKRAQRGYQAL